MDLRKKAEKRLKEKKGIQKTFSRRDFDEVVHELYVHQIELEMQNESLKQAQLKIEESCDEYLQLFDKAPVGYVNLNVDGYINKVNDTFAQMLDRPKIDVVNRSFVEFMLTEVSDLFHVHLVESLKKNSFGDIEIRFKRVDGSFISGLVHGEITTAGALPFSRLS
ncbi:PAS domain-containing protein [Desulforhopalus vacuolatus]|uniref:PAS domain-containing protein n=1 Tax=Desulforhopalus vacuolatus TaxID=40414 RepID=UPI001964DC7E|nr:PAS domain-containing protein [Desulforhopalus vacuolatus]MBM9520378.1 PAS domain-containing protein [Desulforhopalus vacuolatus]